jgi:hypothetical protein
MRPRAVNDSPRKGQGLIAIGPGLEIMVAEGQDPVEPHLGQGGCIPHRTGAMRTSEASPSRTFVIKGKKRKGRGC